MSTLKQENKRLAKHNDVKNKKPKSSQPNHDEMSSATTSKCHLLTTRDPSMQNSLPPSKDNTFTAPMDMLYSKDSTSTTQMAMQMNTSPSFNSSVSTSTPSMVSHWIPINYKSTFQRPGSLSSLVTHCAMLPSPGSFLITKEEFLEAMEKMFKDFWKPGWNGSIGAMPNVFTNSSIYLLILYENKPILSPKWGKI